MAEPKETGASSSDEDSDMEDDLESKQLARLTELNSALEQNPFDYQSHVDKVEVLKSLCELEQLRAARETFASRYPLSADLWLSWLRDEQKLASAPEESAQVFKLFERAVADYVSVELWLEFCQFSLGGIGTEEGVVRARDVFERALSAAGLHVAKGGLIWDAYREFESALLSLMTAAKTYSPEELSAQNDRLRKVFERQLTVPLLDMDKTMSEYVLWLGEDANSGVQAAYKHARDLLSEREPFEVRLMQASGDEATSLSVYAEYLALERKAGLPTRIQHLYERRITDHCLVSSVWSEYLKYLDGSLRIESLSLPVHERALRNCPWSGALWVLKLRALERFGRPHEEALACFEQALQTGFTNPTDYATTWLAYIDSRRRTTCFDSEKQSEEPARGIGALRELFSRAVDFLARIDGADPDCSVARYWAAMEGDRFRAMDKSRSIWADVMVAVGERARFWLEYIHHEKMFGDTKHLRKLFVKALERASDAPEQIGEAWVQFEREEGSLEQFEEAEAKFERRMEKVLQERAVKQQQQQRDGAHKRGNKETAASKHQDVSHSEGRRKRKFSDERQEAPKREKRSEKDSGFKVPPPPGFKAPSEKAPSKVAPPPGYKPTAPADAEGDRRNAKSTVFLSNLDFSLDEAKITAIMAPSGEVKEVRLVKHNDRSKGFAYVEFGSVDAVARALQRDRELIDGRPMFVSEYDPEKRGAGHKFQFGKGLEKCKLFVRDLATATTKEQLEQLFGEHGKLREVRLVTYRNGHSKGIAFVEFESESAASSALIKTNGIKLDGHVISVAISNPPEKKGQTEPSTSRSLGDGGAGLALGPRGRGRTQLAFVPRALQVAQQHKASDATNGNGNDTDNKAAPKKTNNDFRNMLLGKK